MTVDAAAWLELIEREYLDDLIPAGGAAVRFAVAPDGCRETVAKAIEALARGRGMVHVAIDVAAVRLHMIQDVFFAIAREIDWEAGAQAFVEDLFARQHLSWPHPGEATSLAALAAANGIDAALLRPDVQRWLTAELMRDSRMAQDFRVALLQLCRRRFELPGPEDAGEHATLLEWLHGEARRVGPLRRLQIGARIGRHNARAMLRSLCRWLRLCGHPGLAVTLDIRQLARSGAAAAEAGIRYGPSAVMDAYEVLRQLVDDAERMEGLFLTVLADEAFLDGDARRSIDAYVALKMRIWPDVHALGRDNPLAPLVQLDGRAGAGEVS